VDEESFGSALQYFTGSKEHNIQLRKIAMEKDWKLSEYGIREKNTNKKIAGENEKEIYKVLGLEFIEPELREDNGEIDAAKSGGLPELVRREEIKGDLHLYSRWGTGKCSIKELTDEAINRGYGYMAICDVINAGRGENRFTVEKLQKQTEKIRKIDDRESSIRLLAGAEVSIEDDGNLNAEQEILNGLDLVIATVRSGFKKDRSHNTRRIIKAINSGKANIIGNPTGRIIHERPAMDLEFDEIFQAASENDVFLEINSNPRRLDLSDTNCMRAKRQKKSLFSINSCAVDLSGFWNMRLGIGVARRGWLSSNQVINTYPPKKLLKILEKN
jgi:DNA polymerase (family 10)